MLAVDLIGYTEDAWCSALSRTLRLCFSQHSWRQLITANWTLIINECAPQVSPLTPQVSPPSDNREAAVDDDVLAGEVAIFWT